MTHKEIAERLRGMSNRIGSLTAESLHDLADTLDPPRPEPGTVVWVRSRNYDWSVGMVLKDELGEPYIQTNGAEWDFEDITWKPARILAPDDPGEEAYSDVLHDRIQAALEYTNTMWTHNPMDHQPYRQDLMNLTLILEGRAEADR